MKASNELIKKLMELEGLRLEAYRDAAGVPTIGYGHTRDVRMGDRITAFYARELLLEDVAGMTRQVEALGGFSEVTDETIKNEKASYKIMGGLMKFIAPLM